MITVFRLNHTHIMTSVWIVGHDWKSGIYIYIYIIIIIIIIIINTHGRFAIAFLPLTTRLSTELFEAVFIKKSSG